MDENSLRQIWDLRRMASLVGQNSVASTEASVNVLVRLAKTPNNAEFLANLAKDY